MKLYRIKAIMFRHLLVTFRIFNKMIDLMFWPLLNIIIWGFNTIQQSEVIHSGTPYVLALVASLLMWQILFRANMEISYSLVDELTSYNFSNIFSTPLHKSEWVIAVIGVGIIKATFTLFYGVTLIWLLYSINIFTVGWPLALFIFLSIIIGWIVGFISAAGISYWGQSMRELIWVVVWFFVPLSGIFYSIRLLPKSVQTVAWFIPHSHLFEALRSYILTNVFPTSELTICCLLSLVYFIAALLFFNFSFEESRKLGFLRFERDS